MGYREYLADMLKPMGVYDVDGGYSGAELAAVGAALDGCAGAAETLEKECIPATAENYGLEYWENLFPILLLAQTAEQRSAAVSKLLRTDDASCTAAALEEQFAACGIPCEIGETDRKYVVSVRFTSGRGEPEKEMTDAALAILPAHVSAEFTRIGVSWDRIESLYHTWDEFDACGYNAYELMKLE